MHYVIGSGPAGVAAASALLDRGLDVTMLDVGEECDPDRLAAVTRIAATRAPEQWTREDFRTFRGDSTEQPAGSFPIKRMFGSDFAYAADDDELRQIGTSCVRSHAKGGLSNVWGAAVLPNLAADLDDWPVTLDDLKPHYARVAQLMPVAGAADDLEGPFPFYERPAPPLRPSRLAAVMLARMRGNRERLSKAGLRFGQSRLAVRTDDESGRGCQYTGLCLSGCPYFAIWNSATVVNSLRQNPRFTYQPGWHVDRIEPASAGVRLIATRVGASDPVSFEARHAFVACGPIATMRVVIDSLRAYDRSFSLRFQPYFLLPFVALDHTADVEHERLHTLAQIFMELVDPAVSSHTVHLQVYTFNPLMAERLQRATAWLGPLRPAVKRALLGRLMAVQGYLHSSEAPPIRVTVSLQPGRTRLTLTAEPDARVQRIIGRVRRALRRNAAGIGAIPLALFQQIGRPGDGNHVGAAFPMRRTPGEFETDSEGQLPGLRNVHLVDAISLPSLAATTFTYTTMANAHRIADAVARRG